MYIPEIPNNSLSDEINEIVYIAKKTEHKVFFEFNQPATDDELLDLEKYFNTTFPESYKDFMHFSNGANIADAYIIFFNISEVKSLQIATFPDDYIIIGKIIGDGEVLCISKKGSTIYSIV
ncbi:SMI1/KNR4 family protein [Ruminococcus flavefaciens]|uniref:SMI1/KNR4 family protein n=1 Tax=Ruminococcus flavefaciens TaxID=1265 RepID=UPI0026EE7EA5|nr:SMI1/KNR4 family protein [Ruminococcus flavefaciens]